MLVDAHVHFQASFDLRVVLDAAASNFAAADHSGDGVLLLTETQSVDRFAELASVGPGTLGDWRAEATAEVESLLVQRGASTIAVISGRQIITAERLEVLALATRQVFADGQSVDATLAQVSASGATAVLPYAFGKWRGRRLAVLKRVLADDAAAHVLLGDNGNRLALAPRHPVLRAGRVVLPGSDPLPLPGEDRRAGSYGFRLDEPLDRQRPAAQLRQVLRSLQHSPAPFGSPAGPIRFVRSQLAMQRHKRSTPTARPS